MTTENSKITNFRSFIYKIISNETDEISHFVLTLINRFPVISI
uniref:Uncharacterized protein n=1 Tax=Anguilla anguilla TaxID=7936 RepID=A0A0E9US59_ANGAN